MLPEFVRCIEPVVIGKCGEVPLNVLRALSSQDVCAVEKADQPPPSTTTPSGAPPVCSDESARAYRECVAGAVELGSKYSLTPITLLNTSTSIAEVSIAG